MNKISHLSKAIRISGSVLLAFLLLFAAPLRAQQAEQPEISISLVTFAPGEVYWQRYGHNALLVRERRQVPWLYNYGMFDFRQKNFFLNFARGQMNYQLAAQPLDDALRPYLQEGRWVREQVLNFSDGEARSIKAYLESNAQPQNAEYRYNYFTDNCSTRVRDALDRALDGGLRRTLEAQSSGLTWRFEALRHMAPAPFLALGVDALLGPRTDVVMNRWEQSFLPVSLMDAVARHTRADGQPLLRETREIPAPNSPKVPASPPHPRIPLFLVGLLLAGLLATLPRPAYRALAVPVCLLMGGGGLVLLLGAQFTDHWVMQDNRNILLFNPLGLVLLPLLFLRVPLRAAALLATLILLCTVAVVVLGLWQSAQPQLHWLLFWLPVQLALGYRMTRHEESA